MPVLYERMEGEEIERSREEERKEVAEGKEMKGREREWEGIGMGAEFIHEVPGQRQSDTNVAASKYQSC